MKEAIAAPGNQNDGWLPGVAEHLGCYVYLLIDPRSRRPFYVGKGTGDRCFEHVAAARKTTKDRAGEHVKLATIRAIEKAKRVVQVQVLRHGLDDRAALAIESAAIDLLGLERLANKVAGHEAARHSVDDLNALYGAKPIKVAPTDRVVLVRIARKFDSSMTDRALYEATRKWWRISGRRRSVGHPSAPNLALAVHEGVVRAVFRIERWEPALAKDVKADPKRQGRWCFVGDRDAEREARYRFKSVVAYLPVGLQNPLRFVQCAGRGE